MRVLVSGLVAGLLAAGLVAGCGDDGGGEDEGATVVLNRESVAPGGKLKARVRNRTDAQINYGHAYRLQREVDGSFESIENDQGPVIQIALVAEPGETGPPVTVELPADAEPGHWRVVLGDPAADPQLRASFDVSG